MRPLRTADALYHRRVLARTRRPRADSVSRSFGRTAALVAAAGVVGALLAACTEVPDPSEETIAILVSEVPTTALSVDFLDVTGYGYCAVVDQVSRNIQVYADPASDFADPGGTRETYVGALRGFDALDQVAPGAISADVALMRKTLDDSVTAGLEANWDIVAIKGAAAEGVDAKRVAAALAAIRRYTLDQCQVDLTQLDARPIDPLSETPEERIRRVLAEILPGLDDRKIACVEPRLPLDFDPDSIYFDEQQLLDALAGCRIDINDISAPTSVPPAPFRGPRPTTPTVTTMPNTSIPEYGGDSEFDA